MFTNNMLAFMQAVALSQSFTNGFSCTDCAGTSFKTNIGAQAVGFLHYMDNGRCCAQPTAVVTSYSGAYAGVYFGTGNTPATKADYNLESLLTSGLSIQNGTRIYNDEGNGVHSYHVTFAVTNTTSAEINIYEIGLFAPLGLYNSEKYHCTLIERTVLTEPITIAPGETKLVTYKITFNQTLNEG